MKKKTQKHKLNAENLRNWKTKMQNARQFAENGKKQSARVVWKEDEEEGVVPWTVEKALSSLSHTHTALPIVLITGTFTNVVTHPSVPAHRCRYQSFPLFLSF